MRCPLGILSLSRLLFRSCASTCFACVKHALNDLNMNLKESSFFH